MEFAIFEENYAIKMLSNIWSPGRWAFPTMLTYISTAALVIRWIYVLPIASTDIPLLLSDSTATLH